MLAVICYNDTARLGTGRAELRYLALIQRITREKKNHSIHLHKVEAVTTGGFTHIK